MNYYTRLVLAWPKTSIAIMLTLTFYFFLGLQHLSFDNTVEAFMPKHEQAYVFFNEVKKIYGNNDLIYMLDVTDDTIWSKAFFVKLNNFITEMEEYTKPDKDRETRRMVRLESIVEKGNVTSEDIVKEFPDDPVFQRVLQRKFSKLKIGSDILSARDIKKLKKALNKTRDFKNDHVIDRIVSLFQLKDISGKNDEIVTYDIIEKDKNGNRILPESPSDFSKIKRRLQRTPSYKDGFYAYDEDSGEITDFGIFIKYNDVTNYDPITHEIYEIVNYYNGLKFASLGLTYVNMQYNDYMKRDLEVFLPIVLIIVVMVFFYNFRSLRGVILPFFILCAADIWVLGLMGHVGHPLTSIDISLPVLMIAIGSSYSIHILNQYYYDFDLISQKGKDRGLYISMTHISTTVLLAALTTMFAFITLTSSDLVAIKKWALFSSFGVFAALILSITIIPAGLMLFKHKTLILRDKTTQQKNRSFSEFLIKIFTAGATRHSKKVMVVSLVIAIISAIGITKLNVETQIMLSFKKNDPVRKNYDIISKNLGGEIGISVIFDSGEEYGALTPEFLNYIEHIREWVARDENKHLNFGRTDAFGDFIKIMHRAMNNDNPDYYKIPDSKYEIMDYIELYTGDDNNNDGRADDFEPFIDGDYQSCLVSMRFVKSPNSVIGTNKMKTSIEALNKYIDRTIPKNFSHTVTGNNILIIKFCDFIIDGQVKSLLFSLGVIALIVFLLFNNLKAGLLALIPMSNAVLISFGIMGWFSIDLDIATSVIAAITIGIGVDDTIHFLNTYRYYLSLGEDVNSTIKKTLKVSGKAILFTSFALILGFGVLTLSTFKPLILFGLLMAITMIATTIGALLILPSVIKVTQIDLKPLFEERGLRKYVNIGRIFGLE